MKTKLLLLMLLAVISTGFSQVNSVAVVGEAAGGWPGDPGNPGPLDLHQMTSTDGVNWTLSDLTLSNAADGGGIKFRANNDWAINWGSADFPVGTGTQNGANILCTVGSWNVEFNSETGAYSFTLAGVLPIVKLIGTSVADPNGLVLSPIGENVFRATNVTLLDGTGQWSIEENGNISIFGETAFPDGELLGNQDNMPVVAGVYSSVTLNYTSGAYSFVLAPLIPPVSIVGDGVGGWPGDPGNPGPLDINQLTSTDGTLYKIDKLACTSGPGPTPLGAKFRQDNAWTINWGNAAFPSGTATLGGDNILIGTSGTYDVTFNRATGEYNFVFPTIAIVGAGVGGWPGDPGNPGPADTNQMTTTDGLTYTINDLVCVGGEAKFRQNNGWDINWGDIAFPAGTGTQNGPNIVLAAGTYDITLNRVTGEYNFTDGLSTTTFNTNAFKVFPNPTNNTWNFVSTTSKNITSIQIVDMLGKNVMTITPAATTATVDASSITSGLYFAKITTASGTETVKLMKN